jgi:hypothetical protein
MVWALSLLRGLSPAAPENLGSAQQTRALIFLRVCCHVRCSKIYPGLGHSDLHQLRHYAATLTAFA